MVVNGGSCEVIGGSVCPVVNLVVIGDVFAVVFNSSGDVIDDSDLSVVDLVVIGDVFVDVFNDSGEVIGGSDLSRVDLMVIGFCVVTCEVGEACGSCFSVVVVSLSTNKDRINITGKNENRY